MELVKPAAIVILLGFAAAMWYGFIRPVPEQTAMGRILAKYHKPEGETVVSISGANRGFQTPTRIPIAEAYLFDVELDGGQRVGASLNVVMGRDLGEGQRVRVRYIKRGFPPFWSKLMVTALEPAGES
ncbi:MAG: hypothetical protein FIB01_07465 [Gemmatimonadetes bacterium]|nr:hypothetical protein [Gemmatimonadota bacterium]